MAGQYNYCNFATNYKRLQKKFQNELSPLSIDSNNHNNTLFNSQNSSKKSLRKRYFKGVSLWSSDPKEITLKAFFVSFTLFLIQVFIMWTWAKSINHLHWSAVIHAMNSISTTQNWKNVQQNKGTKQRDKINCSGKINICFLVQRKHCCPIILAHSSSQS